MPSRTHLPAQAHPGLELRAAGQPDLRSQQRTCSDLAAVSNHHQVIDLGPAADHRGANRGPVNGGVRADLYLILQNHGASLGNFVDRTVRERDVAEPVPANHHPIL